MVAQQILARYGEVHYEETKIRFIQPEKKRFYKPDFVLPNGIIVETKGRFVMADRQKHLWVKEQYPNLDIRFVFTNPNVRISKKSATTYASWCDNYGFIYAKGTIPEAWFLEEGRNDIN